MSLLTSFTRGTSGIASGGFQAPDRIEPIDSRLMSSTTTAAFAANSVYLTRFRVGDPFLAATMGILLGATVAGNVALGIYTGSGTTYTRVAATADTAASGANAIQNIALSSSYLLVPGVDYWASFGLTDATLTVLRLAPAGTVSGAGNKHLVKASAYSSGLPSSISTPVGSSAMPWIEIKS